MKQNMTRAIIAPALLLMLLTGCVKRELEMPPAGTDGYAEIALDWGGDARPQTARYLFYNEAGALVKEAEGITGGFKGTLPAGTYRLIVHNEDALQVDYRGLESYATTEVFALSTASPTRRMSTRADSYIREPQQVFGTGVCKEFDRIVIEPGKTTHATACPTLLTHQVQFLFNVKGGTEVRSLEGTLGGISPGVFLATGKYSDATVCSLEFTAAPRNNEDDTEFVVNVVVFNLITTPESPAETNTIDVTLTQTDGTQYNASFDLTETLQEIIGDNGGVIPIEIPVEVILEVKPVDGLTAIVRPWDDTGTGSGDVNTDEQKQ